MNFEIQALGGKLIGSRSALRTLDRLTTLLPNAEINFETLTIPTEIESDEDDDDIMYDPDIQEMVKNGEHTCHMFDAHCQACEDDEEDEDDITLAELKEQLEDNMTLAEIQKELVKVEATKKRLETIRLKKEKKEEEEVRGWVNEMTHQYPRAPDFGLGGIDHVPNF